MNKEGKNQVAPRNEGAARSHALTKNYIKTSDSGHNGESRNKSKSSENDRELPSLDK